MLFHCPRSPWPKQYIKVCTAILHGSRLGCQMPCLVPCIANSNRIKAKSTRIRNEHAISQESRVVMGGHSCRPAVPSAALTSKTCSHYFNQLVGLAFSQSRRRMTLPTPNTKSKD